MRVPSMWASDQPSGLARLGPSATGTGDATDSEMREAKVSHLGFPDLRVSGLLPRLGGGARREARMCHGEMMADHAAHSVERLIRLGRLHRSTACKRRRFERVI